MSDRCRGRSQLSFTHIFTLWLTDILSDVGFITSRSVSITSLICANEKFNSVFVLLKYDKSHDQVGVKSSYGTLRYLTKRTGIRGRASNLDLIFVYVKFLVCFDSYIIIEVKTSLPAFGRGKKSMSWRHHDAFARAPTRTEFQKALIRFSKLGFPVAH